MAHPHPEAHLMAQTKGFRYDSPRGGEKMDYSLFRRLVEEEMEFLSAFDVGSDPTICKALAALYVLQEYLEGKEA